MTTKRIIYEYKTKTRIYTLKWSYGNNIVKSWRKK